MLFIFLCTIMWYEVKVWLFITDAQPWLHRWDLDMIQQAVDNEWLSEVIIWISCWNKSHTSTNPFTWDERKILVNKTIKEIKNCKCNQIFLIPDFWDNVGMISYIFENLPEFDYIISWDAWILKLMRDEWKKIAKFDSIWVVRWTTIRELIARNLMWRLKDYFSQEVVSYLKEIWASERLKKCFQKDMKNPSLAVDIVVFTKNGQIVLIKRKNPPYWVALPWWFVDIWETLIEAAERETMEEISVCVKIQKDDYLWYWDDPDRDPRAHVISHAFMGKITSWEPKAADDAKELIMFDPKDIDSVKFAFPDHKEMVLKALFMNR